MKKIKDNLPFVRLKDGSIRQVIGYGGYSYVHLVPVDEDLVREAVRQGDISKYPSQVHKSFITKWL